MIQVYDTAQELYNAAAWLWIRAALEQGGLVGVATGTTTTPIHETVARLHAVAPFDTRSIAICAVDDYVGIERGHIASCSERVRRQLVAPLGLAEKQALLPDRFNGEDAPRQYEEAIAGRGGVRMQMLGLGEDGHIGFNYPGTPIGEKAHLIRLPQSTKDTLHRLYALPIDKMPAFGLTLGIRNILMSQSIVVAVSGAKKAVIVRQAILGPVCERVPASALQLHRNVAWLLDKESASLL
jgi:glucosamine-6-phosphate deaminase